MQGTTKTSNQTTVKTPQGATKNVANARYMSRLSYILILLLSEGQTVVKCIC